MIDYVIAFAACVGLALIVALLWIHANDRADERRLQNGAQPLPTARQLRAWRKERLQWRRR